MKKLKGALIGCGFFAENHILAWKELRNIEIICVCDLPCRGHFLLAAVPHDLVFDIGLEASTFYFCIIAIKKPHIRYTKIIFHFITQKFLKTLDCDNNS